jgi:hypothetical protein
LLLSGRHEQLRAMKTLEAMDKHRPVDLFEHVPPQLNDVIRPDPQDIMVERGMMQPTQREAIRDEWLGSRIEIRKDVSRLE